MYYGTEWEILAATSIASVPSGSASRKCWEVNLDSSADAVEFLVVFFCIILQASQIFLTLKHQDLCIFAGVFVHSIATGEGGPADSESTIFGNVNGQVH